MKPADDPDYPRGLTTDERAALVGLLDHRHFPGRDALRAQAAGAIASAGCSCPCASIDLEVDDAAPLATIQRSPVPNGADVLSTDGEVIGGVSLFVADGRMSLLEVYSFGDDPITPFPTANQLRFTG